MRALCEFPVSVQFESFAFLRLPAWKALYVVRPCISLAGLAEHANDLLGPGRLLRVAAFESMNFFADHRGLATFVFVLCVSTRAAAQLRQAALLSQALQQ